MSAMSPRDLVREYNRLVAQADAALAAGEDIGPIHKRIDEVMNDLRRIARRTEQAA